MKTTLRISSVCCVLLMLVSNLPAQDVSTAQLHGLVRDAKGALVQGAKVTVRDQGRGTERTAMTNENGEYKVLGLVPGPYDVSVEAPGFAAWTAKGVVLNIGQQAELPVALSVGTVQQEVTVTGEAELVETQRTSNTTTVTGNQIEFTPINGRKYTDFSKLDSQVLPDAAPSIGAANTSGLNFSGQRARANLVNLDGADNVDASVNGIRSTVSQEAVQEFQVIKDGYNAEYGRASGGVVNIITKSGTNGFHGSAFGYLRNRNLQAQNPFTNVEDPAYTRFQGGIAFGGPIKKDKTFYFFSIETTQRHETGFSTIGNDCAGGVTCFGLETLDVSPTYGGPAGSGLFVVQVTPAQAATIGALGASPAGQAYTFTVGSASAIALNGTLAGTGSIGLAALSPGGATQFASSCNPGNLLCNGLPGDFSPLLNQIGNYPVFEDTTVLSFRLDHRFNNNHSLMARVNYSPSAATGVQVNAQNQNFGQNAYSRTSAQGYDDVAVAAHHAWVVSNDKVNDFRFQYARRDLVYDFNRKIPEGGRVAVNIAGFAFIGREPFSFVDRQEQRWQFADDFSWAHGNHTFKFGADFQHLPIKAKFTVNFGNVYNFGALSASQFGFGACGALCAGMSPVQAYGFGVPSTMVQGIGDPSAQFSVTPVGFYAQDTWKIHKGVTLNLGIRYDVEFSDLGAAPNQLSADAYNVLGIQKGFGTDTNNIAPRIGIAWDPWGDGKTVIRANYGMFYDNPLLGLTFLGNATDGARTPQLILFGGAPCSTAGASPLNLNATNVFQGILGTANCLPPGAAAAMGYLPDQQQFDSFDPNSTFINQNYLNFPATFQPLSMQPFGFPEGKGFEHAYTQQMSLGVERELAKGWSLSVGYNFAHGTHLNRPINANPVRGDLLVENWYRAVFIDGVSPTTSPLSITTCDPANNVFPAALMSFYRPSGLNPSLAPVFGACTGFAAAFANSAGLGVGAPTCLISPQCNPFSDMVANYSNGSSIYHALSVNLRKQMGNHWQMLTSYTWSHTIDDSTDLQSLLSPEDSYFPFKERASSTFDQRHRLVISGIYQSGKVGEGFWGHVFSDWTVAPLIDVGSGRPFTILTAEPVNFQFSPNSSRPNVVPAGTPTNSCGFPAQASPYSPTGFFQTPCFIDAVIAGGGTVTLAQLDGNLGRNSANKPMTVFNDIRFARRIRFGERVNMDAIVDIFNFVNRYNVADVSPLCSSTSCTAGTPTAAYDPRQIQLGLKINW